MLHEPSLDLAPQERVPTLPKVFEPEFYCATYQDLTTHSDAEAELHFRQVGIRDGLLGSPVALRENFVPLVQTEVSILEIGPFQAPALSGAGVRYLDAYDKEELIIRAQQMGLDPSGAPTIDYVSPNGTFEMVDRKFSAAFGCHSIEHQPDFIRHLRNVSSVLDVGGRYYIICPDKRFCFDHFLPETTIADIVVPFIQEARRHSAAKFCQPYFAHDA